VSFQVAESSSVSTRPQAANTNARAKVSRLLGRWIEILVLALVVVSPWLFGGVEPAQEWWLFSGVGLGLLLWALRVLIDRQVVWKSCRIVVCMLAFTYLGFWQLVPLSSKVMRSVSPATQRTLDFLQPEQTETIELANGAYSSHKADEHPLSFYRTATAQTLCRILAALALFALVRNNIPAEKGLLHLSIAASINGVALSLLAILQLFSSHPNQIYWQYNAPASVFGPFICRNHFPFYVNCCIGLALGLLVYLQTDASGNELHERNGAGRRHSRRHSSRKSRNREESKQVESSSGVLRVEGLWLALGLAMMLCAVVLSLSRGGIVVLFAAAVVGFLVWGRKLLKLSPLTTGLVVGLAGAFGLLSWFGFNLIKPRLETLLQGGGMEARAPLWTSCIPLFGQFPIFGTGYGTFQMVEPLYRDYVSQEFNQLTFVHAHNEFIEAMVEGGILRLIITVAAIGFVFAAGYRVLRGRSAGSSALAAGALFAFATVVMHSLVDFGMHVPAITILVAVIAAYIMSLADNIVVRGRGREAQVAHPPRILRWGGLAPILAAGVFAGVGFLLFAQSYQWQLVHRFLNAGLRRTDISNADQQERRIEYLKTAVSLAPEYATTELSLAQAYYEAFVGQQNLLTQKQEVADLVAGILPPPGMTDSLGSLCSLAAETAPAAARWQDYLKVQDNKIGDDYLKPALRYFIAARDLCPLLGKPHARLAAHRDLLSKGDTGDQYMERVRSLRKYDPEVWYISGLLAMTASKTNEAWADWRQSLEYSDEFLLDIARRSLTLLGPSELMDTVIPDKPRQLYRVAIELFPTPAEMDQRQPFLDRALSILAQPGHLITWEEWQLKAQILIALNKFGLARTAYLAAIQFNSKPVDLQIEYAQFLYQIDLKGEARAELLGLLSQDPNESKAKALLLSIERAESQKNSVRGKKAAR
jgi:tetratricopeptide (TPR) repeat protein